MTEQIPAEATSSPGDPLDGEAGAKTQTGKRTTTVQSGARWGAVAQVAVELSRLVVQLVLARLLVPGDFGIITLGVATIVFLDIFTALGTAPAIIQRPTLSSRLLSSMFFINLGLGVAMAGIFYAVAPSLASSAGRPDATTLLRVLGLTLLISSFSMVQQGLIRRQLKFARLAMLKIAQTMTSGVISVVLAFAGFGAWSLVWGQLAGRAVLVVLLWVTTSWRPRFEFDFPAVRSVAGYSLNLTAANITGYFFLNADKLLVGKYLGAAALGVYGLGQQTLMAPVRSITRSVQQVLFPTFARMQDDNEGIGRGYLRACAAIAAMTFPAMAGLAAVAGPLIHSLFDDRWIEAIPVVTILAPVGLLHSLHFTVGVIYNAKGRADWGFRWGLFSGVVTVVSYIIGLQWGITGVAASYAVAMVLLTYPAFAIPFRLIDLRIGQLVRAIAPYGVMCAVMVVAVLAVRFSLEHNGLDPVVVLVASVTTGVVVYGTWILRAKPGAYQDLMGIVQKNSAAKDDG